VKEQKQVYSFGVKLLKPCNISSLENRKRIEKPKRWEI